MALSSTATVIVLILAMVTTIFDIRTLRIPNPLNFTILVAGLIFGNIVGQQPFYWQLFSIVTTYLLMLGICQSFHRIRGVHGLGLGDVKFTAAAAAWVGLQSIPSILMIASVSGLIIWYIAWFCGMRMDGKTRLPFGPFLSLGLVWVWHSGPIQFF